MLYHRLRRANEHFIFCVHRSIVLQFCVMKCNALARRKREAIVNEFTDSIFFLLQQMCDVCMTSLRECFIFALSSKMFQHVTVIF